MMDKKFLIGIQPILLLIIWFLMPQAIANTSPSILYALSNEPYCGSDQHSAHNNYGGFNNMKSNNSLHSFALLKSDGSIRTWGDDDWVESAPVDTGYVKISSSAHAYAALRADGSITAWGRTLGLSDNAPTKNGYISISASNVFGGTFFALNEDGSISA